MWLNNEGLEKCIQEWWDTEFSGPLMSHVAKKLRFIKSQLKDWNHKVFGDLFQKKNLKQQLLEIEVLVHEGSYSKEMWDKEKALLSEYHSTLECEEKIWRQKSCVLWLKDGNKNPKYFHVSTLRHSSHNKIKEILKEDGTIASDILEIREKAIGLFKNLIGIVEPVNLEEANVFFKTFQLLFMRIITIF